MTTTGPELAVGVAVEDWADDALFLEYTSAADPIRSGHTPRVPIVSFPSAFDGEHPSGVEHLELTGQLGQALPGVTGPATSPALLASFLHIRPGDTVRTAAVATSELHIVLRGRGRTELDTGVVPWAAGDVLVMAAGAPAAHTAFDPPVDADTADGSGAAVIYRVTDEPLLRYLGVAPTAARFRATRWPAADIARELDAVASDPRSATRNRVSILLAGVGQPQTLTATHVLWAMFGLLPVGAVQRPHRHQSVALDLIVDCEPGCFTLVGHDVDGSGAIVDPARVDWVPGGAFVTPPGMWHAHFNESGHPAHLFPVQDAGLHTYLRSLDIRFLNP